MELIADYLIDETYTSNFLAKVSRSFLLAVEDISIK